MYGGHITDDWDRRLCKTYLEEYMKPELVSSNRVIVILCQSLATASREYLCISYKHCMIKLFTVQCASSIGSNHDL